MRSASAVVPHGETGVAILGSTGSIGTQTLEVIASLPERFRVISLAARTRQPLLEEQISRFQPKVVAAGGADADASAHEASLIAAVTHDDVDIVVVASSGHAAIVPTIRAIEAGKTIALANKEVIVCAGELIVPLAQRHSVQIRPIDSEHSALWQALGSSPTSDVKRLILTASGGPFRNWSSEQLTGVSAADALTHPIWSMGAKITIDSATLMNKGLELIEARWLFQVQFEQIEVVIHPQSVVHSIVEFLDGSQITQMGMPDMRTPIQYALTSPDRLPGLADQLDLATVGTLTFEKPDLDRFPALAIAREAGKAGATFPTVLSAADDVAVAAFLEGRIWFTQIADTVQQTLQLHQPVAPVDVDVIMEADRWARRQAESIISKGLPGQR